MQRTRGERRGRAGRRPSKPGRSWRPEDEEPGIILASQSSYQSGSDPHRLAFRNSYSRPIRGEDEETTVALEEIVCRAAQVPGGRSSLWVSPSASSQRAQEFTMSIAARTSPPRACVAALFAVGRRRLSHDIDGPIGCSPWSASSATASKGWTCVSSPYAQ